MQAPDVQEKIDRLVACGPLKAWSVLVTILGDLCQSRADWIGGRDLNALAGRMGLSPATTRVALHRLKRDGWIESRRQGRDAAYRLSDMGWAETQAVRDRIYADTPAAQGPVQVLFAPPHLSAAEIAAALPAGAAPITPRSALFGGPVPPLPEGFWASTVAGGAPPGWVVDAVAAPRLRAEYARLCDAVTALRDAPPPAGPAEAATLRLLILHHWRRLRLRHGDLPDLLLSEDWEGATARRAVMAALSRLPRPALGELAA